MKYESKYKGLKYHKLYSDSKLVTSTTDIIKMLGDELYLCGVNYALTLHRSMLDFSITIIPRLL